MTGDLGAWVLSHAVAGGAALNTAAGRPAFVDINVPPARFGPRLTGSCAMHWPPTRSNRR